MPDRGLLARQRAAKGEKKHLAPRVKARPSFFGVLQRMTKVFNVTSLKYGKYDITKEKRNNNKRLIDRAR